MNETIAITIPADLSDLPVRFSHLRAYGRSAAHGRHARLQDMAQTYAMQRGTAVHAIVFNTRKVCGYPGAQRRGKEFEAFALEHPDHEIMTMAEYDKARQMADAVMQCEVAQPYLKGIAETTLRFQWMGFDCRATPDIRGSDYVTELKTSASADPTKFVWHALRMQYPAQLWLQHIGCEMNGFHIRDHYIVCVEATAPYPVTVFHVQPRALDMAARSLMLWAERMKTCEASKDYPPYSQAVVPLDIPEDDESLVYGDEDEDETKPDLTMAG